MSSVEKNGEDSVISFHHLFFNFGIMCTILHYIFISDMIICYLN